MSKHYYLIFVFITSLLSGCYTMVPVNISQNKDVVDFHIDSEGFIFKTNRHVRYIEVYESQKRHSQERKVLWAIVAKKFEEEASTYNLPTLGVVRYGVVPEGYAEQVEATPLEAGKEYHFYVLGPGYGGGGKFVYSHENGGLY